MMSRDKRSSEQHRGRRGMPAFQTSMTRASSLDIVGMLMRMHLICHITGKLLSSPCWHSEYQDDSHRHR